MARRVMREGVSPGPWCVLDAQPLSLLADNDRAMMSLIEIARQDGYAAASADRPSPVQWVRV